MKSPKRFLLSGVLLATLGLSACDISTNTWRFDVEEKPRDFSKIASAAEIARYPALFIESEDSKYTGDQFSAADAITTLHRAPFGDENIVAYRVLVQRMAVARDVAASDPTRWADINAALQWRALAIAVVGGLANAKIPIDLRVDAVELLKTNRSISPMYVESLLEARASAETQIRERIEKLLEYNKHKILQSYENERQVRSRLTSGSVSSFIRYEDEGRTRVRLRIGAFHGLKIGDRLIISVPPSGTPHALVSISEATNFESVANIIELKPKGSKSANMLGMVVIDIARAE